MTVRPLTPDEQRVLGTLMEKARTVPDTYPLSLNLVVTGYNQKSSRAPVMQLSDSQAQQALDALRGLALVTESHGSRVARYAHNFERVYGVPSQAAALLGLLLLRGPQTAAELRINAERWHRFADTSSVEGFLNELAERSADKGGPLARLLPCAPGEREPRWIHLLGDAPPPASPTPTGHQSDDWASLHARVHALEAEVAALRQALNALQDQLGG